MADELAPYIVKAKKGTVLFKEGEIGSEMYFIHSGRIRIEKNVDGTPEVLAVMEKGDFFGEMALIEQVPRTATAVVEDDADLLKVDAGNFEKILKGNIEIAVRMIRKYASRLRDTSERLQMLLKDRKEMDRGLQDIIASVKPSAQTSPSRILARFVGDGNATFAIAKDEVLIGRKDPVTEIVPDLDLTDADKARSVSRRHARLQRISGQFILTEEVGVSNGTFVNGEKIKPGEPITLTDGAKVSFGKLPLVFKIS